MKHEAIDHERLIIGAQIGALRYLRSGAASADLAERAARREKELERELNSLTTADQNELPLDDELPMAANFSRQEAKR